MYSARQVASVLGLAPNRLRAFLRAGVIHPERDEGGKLLFSFQDLVVLRRVCSAGGALRLKHLGRVMRHLRGGAGGQPAPSGISLRFEGNQVIVADGEHRWRADSGQLLLDFQASARSPSRSRPTTTGDQDVVSLAEIRQARCTRTRETPPHPGNAHDCFLRAYQMEDVDPEGARRAYEHAIALDPGHADARVNLGRLLHESGHPDLALAHYQAALAVRPRDPTATFNMGVALEDMGRTREAIRAYQTSIAADPTNADAHYNLARLLDLEGRPDAAFQHLAIYRQLTQGQA